MYVSGSLAPFQTAACSSLSVSLTTKIQTNYHNVAITIKYVCLRQKGVAVLEEISKYRKPESEGSL